MAKTLSKVCDEFSNLKGILKLDKRTGGLRGRYNLFTLNSSAIGGGQDDTGLLWLKDKPIIALSFGQLHYLAPMHTLFTYKHQGQSN